MTNDETFFNISNGNYYRYVAAPGFSWEEAKRFAEAMEFQGWSGYLATITTAEEMEFIDSIIFPTDKPGNTFVGGSDAAAEGTWRWVTGPEGLEEEGSGRVFFSDGVFVGERAAEWVAAGEGNTEDNDYLFIYSFFEPKFNPWNGSLGSEGSGGASGFLVEFGDGIVNNAPKVLSDFIGDGFSNIPSPDSEMIEVIALMSDGANVLDSGTIFLQYAYSGEQPVIFDAYFGEAADDFQNWMGGKNITSFVSLVGDKYDHIIKIDPGAGIASKEISIHVTGSEPYYVYPWYGVAIDVGGKLSLQGGAYVGEVISVDTSVIQDEDGVGPLKYQWLRDGAPISSATTSEYKIQESDKGSVISLSVQYTDGRGNDEQLSSTVTDVVIDPPVSTAPFDVKVTYQDGDMAGFAIYVSQAADIGENGIEDIQFVLSHGVNDMAIDETSIETTFALGVPVYDALTGELELAAIAFPAFTDFATPVLTFDATILNEESPFSITINEILVDDTSQAAVQEQVDFTSVDITTTLLDRFGNSLTDTDVSALVATPGDDVFLRLVSTSSDGSVFEIVASPSEAVSSVDFELVDLAGVRDFQIGEALSEWVVEANTTAADIVRFAGFGSVDGSQDLAAGQETVLATFTTTSDPNIAVEGIVLNQTAQRDIVFGEVAPLSQAGGVSVHEVMRGADVYLFADKQVDEASSDAITANDALQALRLAVGLTKQDGTAEWHDYLAADINRDGQVSANDALNILKSAVGLDDGVSADWVFVDGSGDWADIGRKNTVYEEGVLLDNVTSDGPVDMMGILVGDVNGSYVI